MNRRLALAFLLALLPCLGLARASVFQQPLPSDTPPPPVTVLTYHDVVDDIHDAGDKDSTAITTDHLIAHFDWLRDNGFHMVRLQDVLDARAGRATLPPKAVLLTFDDGLASAYTRVLPLLQAYHYPALFALEGSWMDLPPGKTFDYNGKRCGRDCFLSWPQVRQIQASGLVEIGSHTWNLHQGINANPQGNSMPAAVTLAYADGHYESAAQYRARIRADLKHSADEIEHETGRRPRAIVWPYGRYTRVAKQEAAAVGMNVSMSLDVREHGTGPNATISRLLVPDNIGVQDLSALVYDPDRVDPQRVVQVDLDYVYDRDPAQQEKNLSALLERIKALAPTQVWLQAYADPNGDGTADALYFPNRHMPMRADLFSRVAWQLRTRSNVRVYAWMPVLAFNLHDGASLPRLATRQEAGDPLRLAPWDPRVAAAIGDLYEDLGMHAIVDGVLFSDDAYLRDTDQLGPWQQHSPAQRTQDLIGFTHGLAERLEIWRPQIATARNLYARPVFEPASEAWFAQSLPAFVRGYDYIGLMAMPQLDRVPPDDSWFVRLARTVAAQPGALDRTVFELASTDWRLRQPIPATTLGERMRLLQANGARHVGYYPDDFHQNRPALERIRPFVSGADYPFRSK